VEDLQLHFLENEMFLL